MTEILATWELGRAFGHVAMLAAMARGLTRRGIRTALATRDLVTAAAVADRPFTRTLQAPLHQRGAPIRPTLTYADVIADGGLADPDHAPVLVAAWLQLFDGVRPAALPPDSRPPRCSPRMSPASPPRGSARRGSRRPRRRRCRR